MNDLGAEAPDKIRWRGRSLRLTSRGGGLISAGALQPDARRTFYERARVVLQFGPVEHVKGDKIAVSSQKEAAALIERYYLQRKTIPVLYLYQVRGAAGIGGGERGWRGAAIGRRALGERNAVARELGHAIGLLRHQPCFGVSPFLMAGSDVLGLNSCATRGNMITNEERRQLRLQAAGL